MNVFNQYARYYDLFYRDKDYAGEAAYVGGLLRQHAPQALKLLNLGCGSGRHDRELLQQGYRITGVDCSTEMLTTARRESSGLEGLDYHAGDIRSIRLDRQYDAVVSLFHVISYQTTNDDLLAAFAAARAHLASGGVFIFDCWYGPGVLTDRPVVRTRRYEDAEVAVTRTARPVMYPDLDVVAVQYQLDIQHKADGRSEQVGEIHRMRYLFQPELQLLLSLTGFAVIEAQEWLSGTALALDTWNAVFVCRATNHRAGS